jgi:hypothetical protein
MNTTFYPLLMNGGPGEHDIETSCALRQLPDAAVCRGKLITSRLVECMVKGPEDCPHVVAFGGGYYCWHPQRLEIASRTEAAIAKARA